MIEQNQNLPNLKKILYSVFQCSLETHIFFFFSYFFLVWDDKLRVEAATCMMHLACWGHKRCSRIARDAGAYLIVYLNNRHPELQVRCPIFPASPSFFTNFQTSFLFSTFKCSIHSCLELKALKCPCCSRILLQNPSGCC